ncbi:hypothetical protein L4D76_23630 [Photobacterium sagamiensis]|uniref:hypothetical protein n=1 Tax=Photobacterium sagamiensis TaxID=2910241 RepID=UPI003D0B3E96
MILPAYKLLKILSLMLVSRAFGWLQLWQVQCTLPCRAQTELGIAEKDRNDVRVSWLQMWQQEVHAPRVVPHRHCVSKIRLSTQGSNESKLQYSVLRMRVFSYPPCGNALEQWVCCYAHASEPDAEGNSAHLLFLSVITSGYCLNYCHSVPAGLTARYSAIRARFTFFLQLPITPAYRVPFL